jgi:hemerythrin-like metal-binding domain
MALVVWSEKLSVGVRSIDDQHKKLVTLVNQLHDGMIAGRGKEVVGPVLKGLIDYTRVHFKYEEDLFARIGYADSAAHKKEHADLVRRVLEIQAVYEDKGPSVLTIQVMNFLKDWLTAHILGSDMKYAPLMIAKQIN